MSETLLDFKAKITILFVFVIVSLFAKEPLVLEILKPEVPAVASAKLPSASC